MRYGSARSTDLMLIEAASKHVIELSLCGLGQVAPMPLLGMIKAFREEFDAHINGVCPTGNCPMHATAGVAMAAGD
jgi:NADH:ubiquinone oxidoreductase subunit F (NADH-binding)